MNDSTVTSENNTANKTQADWNVETITEQIYSDLNGAVPRTRIMGVLKEVVSTYEDARIQTYVPIFVRRDTVNQLLSMPTTLVSPDVAIDEPDGGDRSLVNSDLSQHRIAPDEREKTIETRLVPEKPAT